MWVVKANGETEPFDADKIKSTCLRAGATQALANKIVRDVQKKAYDGISTRQVLKMTLRLLEKQKPFIAARYDLKGALFRLGPSGFAFENLIAEILREYGYKTKTHTMLNGFCVDQEVDVIATKDNKSCMIECKYHNLPGIYTGLKEAMYTYARFLDIQKGFKAGKCQKLDEPWLVCNTRFSEDAKKYSECAGLKVIGWSYPKNNLRELIEQKNLYPITMLRKLDSETQERLSCAGLILMKNLIDISIKELNKLTGIQIRKLKLLSKEAMEIYNG
ncbi:MAG: restriction endonuclease [Candidatus Aenigmarchaeota archaeon]|nr:restriction endonuclease [Candidatus Aenigmarchaeota archaeon]